MGVWNPGWTGIARQRPQAAAEPPQLPLRISPRPPRTAQQAIVAGPEPRKLHAGFARTVPELMTNGGLNDSDLETYPYPSAVIGLDDEAEYRDVLRDTFERFGWTVETEVTSDCGLCRADLIVRHPKWGAVGIECKYGEKVRPSMRANALKQVQRYSDATFDSEQISRWAVSVEGRKD